LKDTLDACSATIYLAISMPLRLEAGVNEPINQHRVAFDAIPNVGLTQEKASDM